MPPTFAFFGGRIDILLPSYQPESERCARDREIREFLEGGRIDILLPSYQPESERCARDREIPEFFLLFSSFFFLLYVFFLFSFFSFLFLRCARVQEHMQRARKVLESSPREEGGER